MKKDKISYLPHVKQALLEREANIDLYIKEGNFEDALKQINYLKENQFTSPKIFFQELLCLRKLENWSELELKSEDLLTDLSAENYGIYCLFYVISLFEQAQFELLIEFFEVEMVKEKIKQADFVKIRDLYVESKQIINEEAKALLEKMQMAIVTQNEGEQWKLYHKWQQLNIEIPELFIYMLSQNAVNPFIKTAILQSLEPLSEHREVLVVKDDKQKLLTANDLEESEQEPAFQHTLKALTEVEQSNPSLYTFVLELLQRYYEYIYPFLYEIEDSELVSEAALFLAESHLQGAEGKQLDNSEKLFHYINEIKEANEAYFQLLLT